MYSRAHLLIEREHENLLSQPLWGIEAAPIYEDTIFEWMAKIRGLKDSPWEGGIFNLYIKFDEHFNVRPPQVFFQTIPFHPNVETLLSNPVLKNAVNMDAAVMLKRSPQSYHQMTLECVAASQQVEAGRSPQMNTSDSKVRFDKLPAEGPSTAATRNGMSRVTKLSFDDYHNTWCGIATSKTNVDASNSLLESIKDKQNLQDVHLGLPRQEVEEQMKKQMEDHNILMYGRFKSRPSLEHVRGAKMAQLERMKKIYLPPRQSPLPPGQDIYLEKALPELKAKEDRWEKEVDDLVNWTSNLDSNKIDAVLN